MVWHRPGFLKNVGFEVVRLDDSHAPDLPTANGTEVPMWHEIRVQAQRK